MDLQYRILGKAAACNARLARERQGLFPTNIMLLVALISFVVMFTWLPYVDSAGFGAPPHPARVSELSTLLSSRSRWVQVSGNLDTVERLAGAANDRHEIVTLVDPANGAAVLVDRDAAGSADAGGIATVTGIIKSMPKAVARAMSERDGKLSGHEVAPDVMVFAGRTPTDPRWIPLAWIGFGLPAMVLAAAIARRGIIFHIDTGAAGPTHAGSAVVPGPTWFTGKTQIGKRRQSLFNEPAAVFRDDSGDIIIKPLAAAALAGPEIRLTPATLPGSAIKRGLQYSGRKPRPALLLEVTDGVSGKQTPSAIAFDTVEEREGFALMLEQPARSVPPPAHAAPQPAPFAPMSPPAAQAVSPTAFADSSGVPMHGEHAQPEQAPTAGALETAPTPAIGPVPAIPAPAPALSGKINGGMLLGALLVLLPVSLAVGLVYFWICGFFKLVLLSACLGGGAMGGIAGSILRKAHCRNKHAAGLVAAACGLVMLSGYYAALGASTRRQFIDAYAPVLARRRGVPLRKARLYMGHRLSVLDGTRMFLAITAETGIRIGSHSSGGGLAREQSSGLTGAAAYAYLVADGFALVVASGAVCVAVLMGLYCESCERWYKRKVIQKCASTFGDQMAHACRIEDWAAVRAFPSGGEQGNQTQLILHQCPQCGAAAVEVSRTAGNRTDQLFKGAVGPEAVRILTSPSPPNPAQPGLPAPWSS